MSANNDQKPPAIPTKEPEFFPPPPPGPPPSHAQQQPHLQQQVPQHPDEIPIPDYDIPRYDPAHPHFAPQKTSKPEDDIYDATPTEEHPPPFPPRPTSSGRPEGDGAKSSWSHKLSGWGTKAAAPFNALANKMGSETFLPTSLDKECDKAARILRSFAKDGIYSDAAPQQQPANPPQTGDAPIAAQPTEVVKGKKPRTLLTIPSKVIARAQGLAIFTTARAGFQVSGATGSGILIARKPDGTWSPPSGIQVHSVGAGFVFGLDIYDCVVVINTREALEAFTRTRMSLGSDLAVTAGPWGAGGALDFGMPQSQKGKEKAVEEQPQPTGVVTPLTDDKKNFQEQPQIPAVEPQEIPAISTPETTSQGRPGSSRDRKPSPFREVIKNPVYSYVKSRGFYAGVQIDGTVVTERKDANAAFYGVPISVDKIIKGEVPAQGPMWPTGAKLLFEVLKGAEGWRGQQGQQPQAQPTHTPGLAAGGPAPPVPSTAPAPGAAPGVTAGMQGLNLDGSNPGPSSAFGTGPAPPPVVTTSAADAKAAEAAAESARQEPYSAAPPSYSSPTGAEDMPPAYVEDGQYRPSVDSKTGQH
ncbi:hypothetical protein B0T16DRAFT_324785 [Cercophora newfieldiana]|uniref:Ysc84 actin-binding domain-containing protein n=1 Tax=Cercophora newfieldiana TaxID=92897 RepID=A0AA39Y9Q6_9PEZI|nr:hypothetical protein B0T16DRAFT_324785 [Cercophora newfieldiana]